MKHITLNLAAAAMLAFATAGGPIVFGQDTVQTTTTSAGTISDFSPQTIVVKTESAPEPVRYTYTKSTTYVDENGNPVSIETVRSGLPVTVYYVKDGDNLIASKVIVRKIVTQEVPQVPSTSVEESKSTTTTTTTTNR